MVTVRSRKRQWRWLYLVSIPGGLLAVVLSPPFEYLWNKYLLPCLSLGPEPTSLPVNPPAPPPPTAPPTQPTVSPPTTLTNLGERLPQILCHDWDHRDVRSLLSELGEPAESHDHATFWHYCFRDHGLDVAFDTEGQLHSVRFLTDRYGGYDTYRGQIPGGIRLDGEGHGRQEDRRMLSRWRRRFLDNGDTDCYPSARDELCILYQGDEILSAVFRATESHPRFANATPFRDLSYDSPGATWPPAPTLPTLLRSGSSVSLAP